MDKQKIAIVGGTGTLAVGLVIRWARAGHQIRIGSRDEGKAIEHARAMTATHNLPAVAGFSNRDAVAAADIVVLTVPFSAHGQTLDELRGCLGGKILIDTTVPLVPPKVSVVQLPPTGSLAAGTQRLLGDEVRVVSALHNVAASALADPDRSAECDVLVFGNDEEARVTVIELIAELGLQAYHAGPIQNAVAAEALTSVLISLNRRYRVHGSGIRITGLGSHEPR